MAKFLLWAVVIIAILMVSRILNIKKNIAKNSPQNQFKRPNLKSEEMVRCEHCNIYLPRSEAYMSQGKTWCSPDHAKLGLKK